MKYILWKPENRIYKLLHYRQEYTIEGYDPFVMEGFMLDEGCIDKMDQINDQALNRFPVSENIIDLIDFVLFVDPNDPRKTDFMYSDHILKKAIKTPEEFDDFLDPKHHRGMIAKGGIWTEDGAVFVFTGNKDSGGFTLCQKKREDR